MRGQPHLWPPLTAQTPLHRLASGWDALQSPKTPFLPSPLCLYLQNLLLLGAIGAPTVGLAGPYAVFFVPPRCGLRLRHPTTPTAACSPCAAASARLPALSPFA